MRISEEKITPDRARELLLADAAYTSATGRENRPLKELPVARYRLAMQRGEWRVTGEAIKIAEDGRLLDGRHRLTACVAAGVPFESVVILDVPDAEDVMLLLDSGVPRSVSDVLRIEGVTSTNAVVAIANLVLRWRDGVRPGKSHYLERHSRMEVIDLIRGDVDRFHAAALIGGRTWEAVRLVRTAASALCYEASVSGLGQEADAFFSAVADGVGLGEGDPRLALRNWLARRGSETRDAVAHLHATVSAWNALADGKTLRIIKPWFKGSPFPSLSGAGREEGQ